MAIPPVLGTGYCEFKSHRLDQIYNLSKCSSMVESEFSKLLTRVRFSPLAPIYSLVTAHHIADVKKK